MCKVKTLWVFQDITLGLTSGRLNTSLLRTPFALDCPNRIISVRIPFSSFIPRIPYTTTPHDKITHHVPRP